MYSKQRKQLTAYDFSAVQPSCVALLIAPICTRTLFLQLYSLKDYEMLSYIQLYSLNNHSLSYIQLYSLNNHSLSYIQLYSLNKYTLFSLYMYAILEKKNTTEPTTIVVYNVSVQIDAASQLIQYRNTYIYKLVLTNKLQVMYMYERLKCGLSEH